MTKQEIKFAYFAGEPLGVPILKKLIEEGLKPELVIASPDRKSGRGQKLTPPPVKVWAEKYNIPVIQPTNLKDEDQLLELTGKAWDLFVVVAYNHILPKWLIEIPRYHTLNVHPSLLPKYRGPSPIRSAILADDKNIGVTVMKLDEKMDHGPVVAQAVLPVPENNWPIYGPTLDQKLAEKGGDLLAETIPNWVNGKITALTQDHDKATYTKKFSKEDAELTLDPYLLPTGAAAYETLLKIYGLAEQPGTFFEHNGTRVKIVDAHIENDTLVIKRVVPAGKKGMDFADYLRTCS